MKELAAKKNGKITHPYAILETWKSAGWETLIEDSRIGMEYLNKKYKAYVFLRRSGTTYYEYRKKLENDYTEGHDNYADDVTETYQRLENWRPTWVAKPSPKIPDKGEKDHNYLQEEDGDKGTGEQHFEQARSPAGVSGNEQDYKKGIECFKCGRMGHFTKDCTHDKKENGNELNTEEVINVKYQEKSDAKRARIAAAIGGKKAKKAEEGGAGYFIDSAIIPTFDDQIMIEDDHNGYDHDAYCHTSYQFMMLVGEDIIRLLLYV